jgi:hypothetical protein
VDPEVEIILSRFKNPMMKRMSVEGRTSVVRRQRMSRRMKMKRMMTMKSRLSSSV